LSNILKCTGAPRAYVAEDTLDTTILSVNRKDFLADAFANPQLIINIIGTMGHVVASSNTRILDMPGKKVNQRNNGSIGKSRGRIHILPPETLSDAEVEDLWI
jgi:CRP-like cAMP-binding protein